MSYFGGSTAYAGDPGFFGTLGKLAGGIARGAAGFLTGGPVGAAAAVIPSITGSRVGRGGIALPRVASGRGADAHDLIGATRGPAGVFLPPSRGGMAVGPAASVGMVPSCPKGYQPKKVYVRGMGYQRIGPCVKVRRRNPYNRRAATRAASRLNALGTGMKTARKAVKKAARALD